jgi:BirA family biotin operon repressor/biotin-[acetyl-CoA-carboxylase] ligase
VVEPHDVTIHWLDQAESTNAVARDSSYVHGDVVATLNQTAGRGRQGRTWSMKPGDGVAMTLVVDRDALGNPIQWSRVPLLVATALAGVIDTVRPSIKWPNDLHVDGRKVSGILVEDLGDGRFGIGIGINLWAAPAGLDGTSPTSLAEHGLDVDVNDLVDRVRGGVLDALRDIDSAATLARLENAIDTVGRAVLVELPDGRSMHGVAIGLGESGALLVEAEGFVTELVAGDVTHLRHAD